MFVDLPPAEAEACLEEVSIPAFHARSAQKKKNKKDKRNIPKDGSGDDKLSSEFKRSWFCPGETLNEFSFTFDFPTAKHLQCLDKL